MSARKAIGSVKIEIVNDGEELGKFALSEVKGDVNASNNIKEFKDLFSNQADNYSKSEIASLLFNDDRMKYSTQLVITTDIYGIIQFDSSRVYRQLIECIIDWGDDTIEIYSNSPEEIKHQYFYPGDFTVKIYGIFNMKLLKGTLLDVINFGQTTTQILETQYLFTNYQNKQFSAMDVPTFYNWDRCKNFTGMFYNSQLFNQDLSKWCFDGIVVGTNMFGNCPSFNQPLEIDTSNLINADGMFYNCVKFNQDLSNWNVQNLYSAKKMFYNCIEFNGDLSTWDTWQLRSANMMFMGCKILETDFSDWDVRNLSDATDMFNSCFKFNSELNNWNVSNLKKMERMFKDCLIFNQPLDKWDVSNIRSLEKTFYGCELFNQDISNWNTVKNINLSETFAYCYSFNQNMNTFNTVNVRTMHRTFFYCVKFASSVNNWITVNVSDSSEMFYNCLNMWEAPLSWDTGNIIDMSGMFYNTDVIDESVDFTVWNVNKVIRFQHFLNDDSVSIRPQWKK